MKHFTNWLDTCETEVLVSKSNFDFQVNPSCYLYRATENSIKNLKKYFFLN